MNRRHALKNIGLSMGAMVVTPTVISLLQSCQADNGITWTPEFFSQEEGDIVLKVIDIILPKTDTPSGSEVNVHGFIDLFAKEVMTIEEQELLKNGFNAFVQKALSDSGKTTAAKLKEADLESLVASSLKVTKQREEEMNEEFADYVEAVIAGQEASISDEIKIFMTLTSIRGLGVWGYKNSEVIGKEVLAYDPIPGRQEGCVGLNEATGGKAWAM